MNRRPPIMDAVTLASGEGVYTFSNGTEWECWASRNCYACKWYDPDQAGKSCAFEGAALASKVTPELASLFGWTQAFTTFGPLEGWQAPADCPFRKSPDDDSPDPPIVDPTQLTFVAPDGFPESITDNGEADQQRSAQPARLSGSAT